MTRKHFVALAAEIANFNFDRERFLAACGIVDI